MIRLKSFVFTCLLAIACIICVGTAALAEPQIVGAGTEVIYRCTRQPFGPPVCVKEPQVFVQEVAPLDTARIYKCKRDPSGLFTCATVVLGAPTTPAELTAVMQVALTGITTSVLTLEGSIEINAHGHSAGCREIGRIGNTVYIECD